MLNAVNCDKIKRWRRRHPRLQGLMDDAKIGGSSDELVGKWPGQSRLPWPFVLFMPATTMVFLTDS